MRCCFYTHLKNIPLFDHSAAYEFRKSTQANFNKPASKTINRNQVLYATLL